MKCSSRLDQSEARGPEPVSEGRSVDSSHRQKSKIIFMNIFKEASKFQRVKNESKNKKYPDN